MSESGSQGELKILYIVAGLVVEWPSETDGQWPEHEFSDDWPHQLRYWQRRRSRPIRLGHVFKYAYGYCGLMARARDPDVKRACEAVAYHVL